jgi:hypothetical protein
MSAALLTRAVANGGAGHEAASAGTASILRSCASSAVGLPRVRILATVVVEDRRLWVWILGSARSTCASSAAHLARREQRPGIATTTTTVVHGQIAWSDASSEMRNRTVRLMTRMMSNQSCSTGC